MAKPVAVDVPGALLVESLGKKASQKHRCFLVDYQMPTDPVNQEVVKRIREGALGKIAQLATIGFCGGFEDPPPGPNIENRLQNLIWVNDIAMGCDYLGNYDIHALDAALWVAGQRPVSACGASRICRPEPHGDSADVCSVVFEFADGLVWNHCGEALKNDPDGGLICRAYGGKALAQLNYWGKAFIRGGKLHYPGGNVENLYEAGAMRNIAAFYLNVSQGQYDNPTVPRSIDGVLTSVLGREAAARHMRLTMEQVIRENKKLEVNLRGLKT
jgi:predicted dehydrogenase